MMHMKQHKLLAGLFSAGLLLSLGSCAQKDRTSADAQNIELTTSTDSISYILGMSLGTNIRENNIDVNSNAVMAGVEDALKGEEATKISMQEGNQIVMKFMQQKQNEEASANLKKAEDFLAENKTKEGVKTTDSGLQYKVIKQGDGPIPTESDRVKVHYEGKLLNGEVFDSSYERGEPAQFGVTQVIPGWIEVLQLMPVGSTYEVYVHPDLAYGERGSRAIGPNETLIFKIELLDIVDSKE